MLNLLHVATVSLAGHLDAKCTVDSACQGLQPLLSTGQKQVRCMTKAPSENEFALHLWTTLGDTGVTGQPVLADEHAHLLL